MEYIAIKDLIGMSSEEKLTYLKEQWELDDDCVYGQIKEKSTAEGKKTYTLKNVKNINGKILEYPFKEDEIQYIKNKISDVGIIILGKECELHVDHLVKARIIKTNSKAYNPLLVEAHLLDRISRIPNHFVKIDDNGNVLIEESLERHLIETKFPGIGDKLNKYEEELLDLKIKLTKNNEELNEVNNQISDIDHKRQIIRESLQNEKNELHKIKNECKRDKQKEISRLNKAKEETMKRMDQLKEYVQSKANFLHDLKLISLEQYDYVTGKTVQKLDNEEKHLDFEKDLNGDFDRLISQIQSYLYSQDKYYPKSILEIFLTLLHTNDLIIISGSSGSGKSYLVKSFAQAIGGIAKIIPVKPNWTGSEDLLGYYNPMQKSYMTTPFLDALVAARRDPDHLHLICLDEMNLARVEYYFADFLSVLEEREKTPTINLYSNEEAEHIKSEFRAIIDIFEESRSDFPDKKFANFGEFLQHKEITQKLHEILGKKENNSLIDLYGRVRRMVSGILTIPAEFEFPSNVRIIGTINIDLTTHYFAPKILDRAYLLKFESPLVNVNLVEYEVQGMDNDPRPIYLPPKKFWLRREPYPRYDPKNPIARKISEWNKEFLSPLGIEIGMRVMRQSLLFQDLYKKIRSNRTEQLLYSDTLNIILLLKVLPHFMFDGDRNGNKDNNEIKKHDIVKQFSGEINAAINPTIENNNSTNASTELQRMIQRAEHNDNVYNFWT